MKLLVNRDTNLDETIFELELEEGIFGNLTCLWSIDAPTNCFVQFYSQLLQAMVDAVLKGTSSPITDELLLELTNEAQRELNSGIAHFLEHIRDNAVFYFRRALFELFTDSLFVPQEKLELRFLSEADGKEKTLPVSELMATATKAAREDTYQMLKKLMNKRKGIRPGRYKDGKLKREEKEIEFKKNVLRAMRKLIVDREKVTQSRVSRILNIGDRRNPKDRTFYNRLKSMGLSWRDLLAEAKRHL